MAPAPFPTIGSLADKLTWLQEPGNSDFGKWQSAKTDDAKAWIDLEEIIVSVMGLETRAILSYYMKDYLAGTLSRLSTTKRPTQEQMDIIIQQTADGILRKSDVKWKEEARDWNSKATAVLLPRSITLWKKTQSNLRKKGSERTEQSDPGSSSTLEGGSGLPIRKGRGRRVVSNRMSNIDTSLGRIFLREY